MKIYGCIKKSERKLDDCIDELMKTALETEEVIKILSYDKNDKINKVLTIFL